MPEQVETTLRGPLAYSTARAAIEKMEASNVWPTALNFELWVHVVTDPEGALAREIERLLSSGAAITDQVAEDLASVYLPRARLNEQIFDAGDALTKELNSVSGAIRTARKSSQTYGQTLAGASRDLGATVAPDKLRTMVGTLSNATQNAQRHNQSLERRLAESSREVGRLKDHLEQVRRDASTDGLTNLANRKAFDTELERAFAEPGGEDITVAVLDIDNFKAFNDTWGHQTGDQVIRFVASVIGRVGAPPRFAARYGGEEFAIIFSQESARQVERALEEIRLGVSTRTLRRRSTNEDLGAITISAGFAQRGPDEPLHALVERADGALYASKRGGRNRVTNAQLLDKAAAA